MSSQSLPPRPNLEQLKKQAKSLLKAHRSGDHGTVSRLRDVLPKLSGASDAEVLRARFSLLDAQMVIAKEHGFENWQKLEVAVRSATTVPDESLDRPEWVSLSIGDVQERTLKFGEHEVPGFVVLLEEVQGDHLMPIFIQATEAHALVQGIEDIAYERPLTHDFMADMLRQMQTKPTELRITDCRDETFYAELAVESDGAEHQIDCRPSDGLCVAVREGAPIVVDAELMARVGRQKREALNGSGIEQIAAQLRGDSPGPTAHVAE